MAVISSGLEAGSEFSVTLSAPFEIVSTVLRDAAPSTVVEIVSTVLRDATPSALVEFVSIVLRDTTLGLREVHERMVEHAVAIVLLIVILRAQKVTVVLAIDRLANDRRGWPFGPGGELGESERIIVGVGQ